eukprot:9220888-Pyramimonas_sp.AAC.1
MDVACSGAMPDWLAPAPAFGQEWILLPGGVGGAPPCGGEELELAKVIALLLARLRFDGDARWAAA